jgi:hypothetical protein
VSRVTIELARRRPSVCSVRVSLRELPL